MRISIIVVIDQEGGIGFKNTIPWMGKVPRDMKHFRELTTGHPVIMGHNTYMSMGKALPGRTNIVLSSDKILVLPDAFVAHSLPEALAASKGLPGDDEVFIIGGSEVYKAALPLAERMYLTQVDTVFTCDVFFPAYAKEDWDVVSEEWVPRDEKNLFPLHFVTLERKR